MMDARSPAYPDAAFEGREQHILPARHDADRGGPGTQR